MMNHNNNAKNALKQCQEVRPATHNNEVISHHEKPQSATKEGKKRGQGIRFDDKKTSPPGSRVTTLSIVARHILGPKLILTKRDVYMLIVSFIYFIFFALYPFMVDFGGDFSLIWGFVLFVTFMVYYSVVMSISRGDFSFRKDVPGTGVFFATLIGVFFIFIAPVWGEYAWIVTAIVSFLFVTSIVLGRFGRLIRVRIFGYLLAFLLVLDFILAICFPGGVYR